jgi:hypothetical protein
MIAVDEGANEGASEERHWKEDVPAFWDVVRSHMDERGIEDVEELHRRFLETEWAYIPIPGRHKGKPVPLKEFKRHVAGEHPYGAIYGELIIGLGEVFGLKRGDKDLDALILSYLWGSPKDGVHPTRELR